MAIDAQNLLDHYQRLSKMFATSVDRERRPIERARLQGALDAIDLLAAQLSRKIVEAGGCVVLVFDDSDQPSGSN
jgi:hypothetical protein